MLFNTDSSDDDGVVFGTDSAVGTHTVQQWPWVHIDKHVSVQIIDVVQISSTQIARMMVE